ncbi:MAG TPA: tripartite tricarboxylate transporter TctB family protein [Burkholderiales bacterium]|nr:tripartite tricarboxylate transporter TctB family protein [Burkholderiales bacterium]
MTPEQDNQADPRSVVSMRTMEIIVAAGILIFGTVVAWESWRLGARWSDDGPQAGYFPFYIGVIIAIASLVTMIQTILSRTAESGRAFVKRGQLKLVCAVLAPALVYVLAIQWFGIYLASAIYMTVFMVWLGNYAWWKAVLLGIAVSVSVFLMFEMWFQVPLHKGTLYNPLSLIGY